MSERGICGMIINGCDSFFFLGDMSSEKWKHGILLIHGFTATPAEMRLLGEYLNNKGYSVACMRLAGHSTSPRDMARMTWRDWFHSACDGYSVLAGFCDKISVVGQSMGGLLGILVSVSADVYRIATLAVPIMIHADRQVHRLPPRKLCEGRFQHKKRRSIDDVPDYCNVSYAEMPMVSVHELLELINEVKCNIPRIKCPVLVMQSHNDHTVNDNSANYIYNKVGSNDKELFWLNESGHLLSIGCEKEIVFEKVAEFLEKDFSEN